VGALGGVDADDLEDGGGLLLDREALAADLLGQLRLGQRDPVLHVDGVDVRVGADGEADVERVAPVAAAGRLHVQHVVDADHLGLDRLRDALLHHLGAGSGVRALDLDHGRNDVRELGDRDGLERNQSGERDDDRDDDREPRPVDEGCRDHFASPAGFAGASVALTAMPGRTFWTPSTTTRSPSATPFFTGTRPSIAGALSMRRTCTLLSASTTST